MAGALTVGTGVASATDDGFDAAYPRLFLASMRLAHRMTGDKDLAEDVAAEALARAYTRWRKLRDAPYLDAWVMRVTGNLALDTIRRRGVAGRAIERLSARSPSNNSQGVDDVTALRMALADALATLPRRQRDAIVLRYLVGMDEADVANALGMAGSTVRTHVQRGLAALRSRLAVDLEETGIVSD